MAAVNFRLALSDQWRGCGVKIIKVSFFYFIHKKCVEHVFCRNLTRIIIENVQYLLIGRSYYLKVYSQKLFTVISPLYELKRKSVCWQYIKKNSLVVIYITSGV